MLNGNNNPIPLDKNFNCDFLVPDTRSPLPKAAQPTARNTAAQPPAIPQPPAMVQPTQSSKDQYKLFEEQDETGARYWAIRKYDSETNEALPLKPYIYFYGDGKLLKGETIKNNFDT